MGTSTSKCTRLGEAFTSTERGISGIGELENESVAGGLGPRDRVRVCLRSTRGNIQTPDMLLSLGTNVMINIAEPMLRVVEDTLQGEVHIKEITPHNSFHLRSLLAGMKSCLRVGTRKSQVTEIEGDRLGDRETGRKTE